MRHPLIRIGIVISVSTLLSGCGAQTPDAAFDPSAKARLDLSTSQIVLPLNEYQISSADDALISRARETVISGCLKARGYPADSEVHSSIGETGDRSYGLWNVEWARQYGYLSGPGAQTTPQQTKPSGWDEAHGQCGNSDSVKATMAPFDPPDPGDRSRPLMSSKLAGDAYALASDNPEWKKAREDWWGCLRIHGLTPRTQDGAWSSEQALDLLGRIDANHPSTSDKEQEIRIATTEAQCNQDTRLTQRLGDLEAGYQAPLIVKNQAALNEEKTRNQDYVAAAKKYLAEHQ